MKRFVAVRIFRRGAFGIGVAAAQTRERDGACGRIGREIQAEHPQGERTGVRTGLVNAFAGSVKRVVLKLEAGGGKQVGSAVFENERGIRGKGVRAGDVPA